MILRAAVFGLCIALAAPATAQNGPADQARAALAMLDDAAQQLEQSDKARDRVRALTATIRAFENGLGAMRDGLRQAAIRERALTAQLNSKEAEIASLLGALQSIGRRDTPQVLLHPAGAVGTARAGMVLAELGPALNKRAQALRENLDEVTTLRVLQQSAADRMKDGLAQIQTARAALNQAMAERTDLPQRFTADPTRAAILIASAETLSGFASGLSQIAVGETAPALQMDLPVGELPLPVQGLVLRRAGEADAAGVIRDGILVATRARALVTSPTAATIRYVGPLLDFGDVVMLEPRADSLIVFAGLSQTFGTAGQVISADSPVGLMGGGAAGGADLLSPNVMGLELNAQKRSI